MADQAQAIAGKALLTKALDQNQKLPADLRKWSVSEVCWFIEYRCGYPSLAKSFESEGVDGELLLTLTDDDLNDIGVTKRLQRRKILLKRTAAIEDGRESEKREREIEEARRRKSAQQRKARIFAQNERSHKGRFMPPKTVRAGPCGRCQYCTSGWRNQCKGPKFRTRPGFWSCCNATKGKPCRPGCYALP